MIFCQFLRQWVKGTLTYPKQWNSQTQIFSNFVTKKIIFNSKKLHLCGFRDTIYFGHIINIQECLISVLLSAASLSPSVPYGRLEQFTELVVSPKSRAGISGLSGSPMRSTKTQHLHRQQSPDLSSSSLENTARVPQNHQWGGIADLRSLLRYIIKGTYEPVKELPPVPGIPALFTDSIYRVSGVPPDSLCTINHLANGVIHLFPWRRGLNAELIGGQSSVTYGLLSKVPSPKESRNKVKQAMDKKKNTDGTKSAASVDDGEEKKEEEATVVRLVSHCSEKLAGTQRSPSKGEIHCGRVWVSMLSNSWSIYAPVNNGHFYSVHFCSINFLTKMIFFFPDPSAPCHEVEYHPTFNSENKACKIINQSGLRYSFKAFKTTGECWTSHL